MPLFVSDSFYFGDTSFPWEGAVEPKLFQRTQWLLMTLVAAGEIPLLCVAGAADIFLNATDNPDLLVTICNSPDLLLSVTEASDLLISVETLTKGNIISNN
jgi:hypothetical protein